MRLLRFLLPVTTWFAPSIADDSVQLGLRVPAGFEVTQFAGPELANDIFSLTIDPRRRIVVSGRGYVRILVDDNGDGRADRAIDFADGPADGAQGMLWEGSSLFLTGDGGVRRYRDDDGNGRADGPSELIRAMKTGGEHDAHDIKRGPDGWLYVLCGNMTGVNQTFAQHSTSPIRDPVAGCVIRLSPDLVSSEIVADGFRNAYRMDWSADGELFTFDSDNERCVSLPWYEPTRFYHVRSGGHYGWLAPQRAQWFRLPPYFLDVVAPAAYLGRGSPTGVVCYRHLQFPPKYRGGFFLADWTFGKVWFSPLERNGATFSSTPEIFLEAVGESGFAPTDFAVHPTTGDLMIAIGGRGTRGAVYRVRYVGAAAQLRTNDSTLRGDSISKTLDWRPEFAVSLPAQARSDDALRRLNALTLILRYRSQFTESVLIDVVRHNWDHADTNVRALTAELMRALPEPLLRRLSAEADASLAIVTHGLATYRTMPTEVTRAATTLVRSDDAAISLAGTRLLQLLLGDLAASNSAGTIWEGYTVRDAVIANARTGTSGGLPQRGPVDTNAGAPVLDRAALSAAIAALRAVLPSRSPLLDREIARTLALVQDDDPSTAAKVIGRFHETSDPVDDVHYLAVLARLRGDRTESTSAISARTLLALDRKISQRNMNRDRHWPLRVAELHAELARQDPQLNERLLANTEFGRSDHVLFAQCPNFDRARAAQVFLRRSRDDPDYLWTPALIELIGGQGEPESLVELRAQWDNVVLQEAILQALVRQPVAEDRAKFVEGLNSPQLATVRICLEALQKLPRIDEQTQTLPLVRLMRRLRGGKEEDRLRERAGEILRSLTGQELDVSNAEAWTDWFVRTFPRLASRLGGPDGVDLAAWKARLDQLDWPAGDPNRGRAVYARTGCVACHSSSRAIGPDLRGVTNRFSRDDLFTAILQPSRDVSPRYQTTLVSTADGKVFQGTIIYEAVDSLILQTGADTTIRITNNQIVERRVTPNSLMPAGLIDKLTDAEIADLFAYLKTLR